MAKSRMAEIKVGLQIALALALFVMFSISIGNLKTYWVDTIEIFIKVPSVVGLEPYCPVTYAGVKIGKVLRNEYNESIEMAVICAEIRRDSPVALDSKARFTSASLLAPLFLDIYGGTKEQRIRTLLETNQLPPEPPVILEAEPYVSLTEVFALTADIKNTLRRVDEMALDVKPALMTADGLLKEVSREFSKLLVEFDGLIVDAHPRIVDLLEHSDDLISGASTELFPSVRSVLQGAEAVSSTLPPAIQNADQNITAVLSNTHALISSASPEILAAIRSVRGAVQSLEGRIENIEASLSTVLTQSSDVIQTNKDEIERILIRLDQTATHLESLSRQLEKDPWRVLWKTEGKKDPPRLSPHWDPFAEERSGGTGMNPGQTD